MHDLLQQTSAFGPQAGCPDGKSLSDVDAHNGVIFRRPVCLVAIYRERRGVVRDLPMASCAAATVRLFHRL
jgi:hypothetical protein